MTKLPLPLVDLAESITALRGRELTLATDRGWCDETELTVYWFQGRFYCRLTQYEVGRTFHGPTWYDPPETEVRETEHRADFVKVRELAEWVKGFGVKLEWMREKR